MKRRNLPDNLGFKGKIVAKFLVKCHFLSISNNTVPLPSSYLSIFYSFLNQLVKQLFLLR